MSIQGPYDVDTLLNDALVQSNQPDNGVIPLANQLRLGNDQLMGILTGRLMSAVQGYYGAETTVSIVSGTYLYDIPSAAMGAKLRSLTIAQSDTSTWELGAVDAATMAAWNRNLQNGEPSYFTLMGNKIQLYPTPNQGYTLKIGFYHRPGRLVMMDPTATSSPGSRTGIITAIASNVLTASMGYTDSTLFAVGSRVDIIRPQPPFNTVVESATVQASNSTTVTLTSPDANIQVGDYLNISGESGVPQMPAELHPLLTARWALALLKARGDIEQAKSQAQIVSDLEADAYDFMANRVEGEILTIGSSLIGSYGVFGAYGGIY